MHRHNSFYSRAFISGISGLMVLLFTAVLSLGQATGGVKGKVRNSRGDGISGVEITARRDSQDIKTARSGSKGEFDLKGLEPGVYNFLFDAPGYNSAIRYKIEIKANKTTDLGDRLVLVIDRGTLVIVQGSVFFKDGRSIPGARVLVEKVNGDGTTSEVTTVYTNISGEFTFRQPEGNAKFRMTAKYKDVKASKELEVGSAAIYRLAISLDTDK
jgi:hypothetical protein